MPQSAFGLTDPRVETLGLLTLREQTETALASLALRKGAAVPVPFGLVLPGPGERLAGDTAGAFWMAPGQWMIEGPGLAETDFAAAVLAQAPGCSVTEQTDGWVIIEIDGPADRLEALRERLVNLPPEVLAPGRATRTLLHHMSVFILRPAEGRLTVMGMRSMAGSLWHALEVAAGRLA